MTCSSAVVAATVQGDAHWFPPIFRTAGHPSTEQVCVQAALACRALHDWVKSEMALYPKLALLGDYNIAPDDRDDARSESLGKAA